VTWSAVKTTAAVVEYENRRGRPTKVTVAVRALPPAPGCVVGALPWQLAQTLWTWVAFVDAGTFVLLPHWRNFGWRPLLIQGDCRFQCGHWCSALPASRRVLQLLVGAGGPLGRGVLLDLRAQLLCDIARR